MSLSWVGTVVLTVVKKISMLKIYKRNVVTILYCLVGFYPSFDAYIQFILVCDLIAFSATGHGLTF